MIMLKVSITCWEGRWGRPRKNVESIWKSRRYWRIGKARWFVCYPLPFRSMGRQWLGSRLIFINPTTSSSSSSSRSPPPSSAVCPFGNFSIKKTKQKRSTCFPFVSVCCLLKMLIHSVGDDLSINIGTLVLFGWVSVWFLREINLRFKNVIPAQTERWFGKCARMSTHSSCISSVSLSSLFSVFKPTNRFDRISSMVNRWLE